MNPYQRLLLFSGAPCINDDEAKSELDIVVGVLETGCSRPDPPENGFIRVSMKND